ncbi:MAG: bifunctional oligoribonuclease/PAP phosphatase NrnA [Microgenomates group bacterium]
MYGVFEDWNIEITEDMATCLLTGIIGDTGSFQYELTKAGTHAVAAKLYEANANHELIFFNLYRTTKFESYQLLELFLKKFVKEKQDKFVWTAVSFEEYSQLKDPEKTPLVDVIIQTVADTNFGIRILEKEKGVLNVALRSRYPKTIDISVLAKKLGGGGHVAAAGARITEDFSVGCEKILNEARNFAKEL